MVGRWRWAAHARRCAACAEVRTAARFVEAFAARAGRWPAVGEAARVRGRRRAWKLAGAVVVIALLLPLAGSVVWRVRESGNREPGAAVTEEALSIRTIHETGKQLLDGQWMHYDKKIEYPDKLRYESPDGDITIRNGDRELYISATMARGTNDEQPYHYVIRTPSTKIPDPNIYTEAWHLNRFKRHDLVVTRSSVSTGANGEVIRTFEARTAGSGWPAPGVIKSEITINPKTGLLAALQFEQTQQSENGTDVDAWVAESIQYNVTFADDVFDTTVPEGQEFIDERRPE